MKRILPRLAPVALALMAYPLLVAAPLKITLPPETARFKAGPGADQATANCMLCHSVDYIATQPKMPLANWKGIVTKMRDKFGAQLTDAQITAISDYLAKNYGTEAKP